VADFNDVSDAFKRFVKPMAVDRDESSSEHSPQRD
jgi:hypothetical protein